MNWGHLNTCQQRELREVELLAVGVAEVAEEVVPSQMPVQLVFVDEASVAELAEGMASVRGVVGIAFAAMQGQRASSVRAPLVDKDLEMAIAGMLD